MKRAVFFIFFFISTTIFSDLSDLSKTFTKISKDATKSVVFVKSEYKNRGNNLCSPFDFFGDEFFKHFFGNPQKRPNINCPPQFSAGSAFIVSEDGYIMTNNHLVEDADKITIVLKDGKEHEAKLIGSDKRTDLAVLKIEASSLPFLKFGDSDKLEVGEWVLAIGNPLELKSTVTAGIVSAKGRVNLRITDLEDFIQTDAAINPGNSGGPLMNLNSEVIGINTAIASSSGGYMGIGFAIPSNMAKHVMDEIIKNGSVERGYMGIVFQELNDDLASSFNLKKSQGILVAEVIKNSPAEKAGIKQGDIILEYDKTKIKNMNCFKNAIASLPPGKMLSLKILRDGKERFIKIKLGTYPKDIAKKESSKLGIEVSELKNISPNILNQWGIRREEAGVVITHVKRGSIAERAGLRHGMLILQINRKNVTSVEEFQKALKNQKDRILMLIRFQGVTRFVSIKMS